MHENLQLWSNYFVFDRKTSYHITVYQKKKKKRKKKKKSLKKEKHKKYEYECIINMIP